MRPEGGSTSPNANLFGFIEESVGRREPRTEEFPKGRELRGAAWSRGLESEPLRSTCWPWPGTEVLGAQQQGWPEETAKGVGTSGSARCWVRTSRGPGAPRTNWTGDHTSWREVAPGGIPLTTVVREPRSSERARSESLGCEPQASGTPGRADPSKRGDPPRSEGPATCVSLVRGSVSGVLRVIAPHALRARHRCHR